MFSFLSRVSSLGTKSKQMKNIFFTERRVARDRIQTLKNRDVFQVHRDNFCFFFILNRRNFTKSQNHQVSSVNGQCYFG